MSDTREQSPDWLRAFQTPHAEHNRTVLALSSDSEDSRSGRAAKDDPGSPVSPFASGRGAELIDLDEPTPKRESKKVKSPGKGQAVKSADPKDEAVDSGDEALGEDDGTKDPILPNVSSRLPLVLSEKVQRSKALVECDGDSIDLSGDVGAVGRIVISEDIYGKEEMLLDLKGMIYKSTILPSATFCVVSFGQTEAKIESVMTDFIQLKPHSNVFEAETMIEGTLDGFSFDSEDEGDILPKTSVHQDDQDKENGDQANGRSGAKMKTSGPAKKKAKIAAKPTKKAPRKPPTTKGKGNKK